MRLKIKDKSKKTKVSQSDFSPPLGGIGGKNN